MQEEYKSLWLRKLDTFSPKDLASGKYRSDLENIKSYREDLGSLFVQAMNRTGLDEDQQTATLRYLNEDKDYEKHCIFLTVLIKKHRELLSIEKQTTRADIETKIRYLIFRILTAIGIAAVILGTGYIAHKLGIPLPLLRIAA